MSFNYDKFKQEENSDTFWASYSDLYTMLSIVFLMMYVVASVRTGTASIQQGVQFEQIQAENEDLRQQIKVYNTLKEDYLQKGASDGEQQLYAELMDKLSLLQEDAKGEKDKMSLQAIELQKKELALNKYQQVIRNIVNANMMAQSRIKKREEKIVEVETKSKKKIKDLRKSKQREIAEAKEQGQQALQVMEQDSMEKLSALQNESEEIREKLKKREQSLKSAKSALETTQSQLEKEAQEKTQLVSKLESAQSAYEAQAEKFQQEYEAKVSRERLAFEKRLATEKMSASVKERELEKFRENSKSREQQHSLRVAALNSKVKASEFALKKAQETADARGKLAKKIQANFARAGIKAEVDARTGDVVLAFGEEYFDTGKAELKPGMRKILQEMMPVYAKSLFENKDIADKLGNVEIVGFASPTYKGKYIDPNSMDASDKQAVNFNLDLSYYRAKSIFNHVFDRNKMEFGKQDDLMRMVKVTGRSFLAEKISNREVASGMSEKEFCKVYNCKKAQRVIIKFNLKD